MGEWVNVGKVDDLKDGEVKEVRGPEGQHIALFKVKGDFYAINTVCPHHGGHLHEGELVEEFKVVCPLHGWTFDIRSGEATEHAEFVNVYKIKVEGDDLFVGNAKEDGCCGGDCEEKIEKEEKGGCCGGGCCG